MSIRRRSSLTLAALLLVVSGAAQAAPPAAPAASASQEDPLEKHRERFKEGMDRYKAGQLVEAIACWEPIFRELGEQKGYRLAYDLGVAYAEFGDATRAVERLQAFLAQVEARRARGESLAPIVQKEESDARGRIAGLAATKGRIQVEATPPRAVQIDANEARLSGFVAWVAPGEHLVTFAPGTPDAQGKRVVVHAGETIEVAPVAPPPAPAGSPTGPNAPPQASIARGEASSPEAREALAAAPLLIRHETEHPFSPALFAVSGGLALAATIAAVPLENHAWALHDRYASEQQSSTLTASDKQSFNDARSWAYATVGTAVALGAVTVGLMAWYFFGISQREVVVTPAGVSGRF
jgi:hypothetical protein